MIIYFKTLLFVMIIMLLNSCFDNNPSVNFIVDDEIVLEINDEKVNIIRNGSVKEEEILSAL